MMSLTNYYTYNTEKAKELLTEAGYPNGFDMTITVPSNYQPHMDTAQVIVEQLKAVGINATIQPVTWESWVQDTYSNRQFQSTVVGVDASNMTARAMLERFVSTAGSRLHQLQQRGLLTRCSPRLRPAMTMGSRPPFTRTWKRT